MLTRCWRKISRNSSGLRLLHERLFLCPQTTSSCLTYRKGLPTIPRFDYTSMASNASNEEVMIEGKSYKPIREGLASILTPCKESASGHTNSKGLNRSCQCQQQVFYNPIQQCNRDLSVLAILIYGESAQTAKLQDFGRKSKRHGKKNKKAKQRQEAPTPGQDENDSSNGRSTVPVTNIASVNGTASLQISNGIQEAQPEPTETTNTSTSAPQAEISGVKRKRDQSDVGAVERGDDSSKKQCRADQGLEDVCQINQLEASPKSGELSKGPRSVKTNGTSKSEANQRVEGSTERIDYDAKQNDKSKSLPFSILDALSATGLRALRYAKEVPFATHVIANDVSPDAVKAIKLNVEHNGVGRNVQARVGDARAYMYQKIANEPDTDSGRLIRRFDVIDLDPYGTAAPFFDAALQALKDGGLLCVTCTDAGVFASNGYPEKAFSLYGGIPVKGYHSHEGGLRLILHGIATSASKHGIAIEPLLSLSIDFYARLFIRIHKRQADVKLLASKTMLVYSCDYGCGAWTTQGVAKSTRQQARNGADYFKHSCMQAPSSPPNCKHCGFRTHLAGPMWTGPLHNPHFIQRILDILPTLDKEVYSTVSRIEGMLTLALEEDLNLQAASGETSSPPSTPRSEPAPSTPPSNIPETSSSTTDPYPFFINISYLAKVLHCSTPPEDAFRGALRHLGYRVTRSHCKPMSIRTDAPWSVLWEVMREWVRTKSPIKEGAVKEGTAGWEILRRMRGSEEGRVEEMKEEIEGRLKKARGTGDLKSELEAALFRLQRGGGEGVEESNGEWEPETKKVGKLNVVFDEQLGKEKLKKRLVRYQMNPRPNWGPLNRAAKAANSDGEA